MKKGFIFLIILLLEGVLTFAQSDIEKAVGRVLKAQESAWNNADLRGFMEGYWRNDSLQFVAGSGITYGWENMLHHYLQAYPDKESMGTLAFSQLQIRKLSTEYCFVVGEWCITRKTEVIGGLFTLLFKKVNEQWRIVVDHTD